MIKRTIQKLCWIGALLFSVSHLSAQTAARALIKPVSKKPFTYPLYLPVRSNLLWGYADTMKHIIITPQFDEANPFFYKYAIVEKNKKAYAIDRTGKIVTPGFDQAMQVVDTVLFIYSNEVSDTLGGWGICTVGGRKLLPAAYDEVTRINLQVFGYRKKELWGMVNIDGTILCEPKYDTIRTYGPNYLIVTSEKKFGIVRNDGKEILKAEFQQIARPNTFSFAGKKKEGWGAVNSNGDSLAPFVYDTIISPSSFFLQAEKGDSSAFYFTRNNWASTACIYKGCLPAAWFWLRIYDFKNACGMIDTNGTFVLPVIYQEINPTTCGDWVAQDSLKKWGLFAHDGKMLIAPTFSHIQPFIGNIAVAFKGNQCCLINSLGEILIPEADQQIVVRGSVVKVLLPDNSATFYTINPEGKLVDKSSYEKLRTLKIGGAEIKPEKTIVYVPIYDSISGGLLYVPPGDSLEWFLDPKEKLYGLRNAYTNTLIFTPQFSQVQRCAGKLTIVTIPDTLSGPMVDDAPTYSAGRVGVVCDTTGNYILQPNYSAINIFDLGGNGFYGCVRATLKDGRQALVSTDGKETVTTFSYIDNCYQGVARVCVDGKFVSGTGGEAICSIEKFIKLQNLNGFLSFANAIASNLFMERPIHVEGGKWGYVDSTGKILVEPQYDAEKISAQKTGIVKKEKKWGLIDMTNTNILPFAFDGLNYMYTNDGMFVQAQNNDLRFGYIDSKGNIVIAPDLHQSLQMGNGFIGFSRTGKWGVMNAKGETICAESYSEIQPFSEGYAQVRRGKLWGYIDTTGKEVTAITYEKMGKFSNGMARVMKNGRWGFINTEGTLVIDTKYLQAGDFLTAGAPVKTKTGYGIISREDKWLLKPTWINISQLETTNYFVVKNESVQGLCRSDGKMLVSPRYEGYKFLGEGRFGFRAGLYWGIMDTSGKAITSTIFDKILPFTQSRAAASQNGNWGYVNRNGHFVIPAQFRSATPFCENMAYVFVSPGPGFYIDTTGKKLFYVDDKCAGMPYSDGKALVLQVDDFNRNHYFYINRRGAHINRFLYDEGKPFKDGVARVCVGRTWGMVSFTGYYVIKPHFYQLDEFDHGLARFQLRYTFGLYAMDGKEILPMNYDAIYWAPEVGMVRFERGNKLGYLFGDGRSCWPETD